MHCSPRLDHRPCQRLQAWDGLKSRVTPFASVRMANSDPGTVMSCCCGGGASRCRLAQVRNKVPAYKHKHAAGRHLLRLNHGGPQLRVRLRLLGALPLQGGFCGCRLRPRFLRHSHKAALILDLLSLWRCLVETTTQFCCMWQQAIADG